MRIKLTPCQSTSPGTEIVVKDANTLFIDGIEQEFDESAVVFPTIAQDSVGLILEAHREAGELYVTIRCYYTGARPSWDDGLYHDVAIGEAV